MSKPKLHSKSKRMTCRKRFKIVKKVAEHHRKKRKEDKLKSKHNKKPKDPGIPNLYPFKEQLLKDIEERKQKAEEAKQKKKQDKKSPKRKLEDLQKDATKRAKIFEKKANAASANIEHNTVEQRSQKSYYKECKKVVEAADVIIEVLDARDPMGCRCQQIEDLIMEDGQNKKLILLLNKIDLVPKDIVEKWLKFLRRTHPALAFKASTQNQKDKLAQSKVSAQLATETLLKTSSCIGASTLMKLLANYCRNMDIKTSITVGVVGLPNVGKSSVINSLRRSKVCLVGSTPGLTKNMQEVQLDKHVKLLDCPGVVMATGASDMQVILRNAVKIEQISDPIEPAEVILSRCNKTEVMQKYCVPDYATANEFLGLFAKRMGKLKKGGVPDKLAAAKILLQDWNSGKISFHTYPPSEVANQEHDSSSVVQYWGAGFDLKALEKEEKEDMKSLLDAMQSSLVLEKENSMQIEEIEAEESEKDSESDGEEETIEDKEGNHAPEEPVVTMSAVRRSKRLSTIASHKVDDGINLQLNKAKRKAAKAKKKDERKQKTKELEEEASERYDFDEI